MRVNILKTKTVCGFLSLCMGLLCAPLAAQLRYEQEYPPIDYGNKAPREAVAALQARLERGELTLEHGSPRGYLDSVLAALDIDPSSQLLVFSKTSLKKRFISAQNPRALYFNDEVYVGWVRGSSTLEIASMDPELGPVFFGLSQKAEEPQVFERETSRCLRCHDTYSLTGGGVPRFMLSSNLVGEDGNIVSHEVSEITDTATPIDRRWGGWYVTGSHGRQRHLGNLIIRNLSSLSKLNLEETGNQSSLAAFFDTGPYLAKDSDIVALLVLEHQVDVQNRMTRANYEARTEIFRHGLSPDTKNRLERLAEPLVKGLLQVEEARFDGPVTGSSGFRDYFEALGPRDSQGRSLRELDLQTRTFKYPLSYLIYSAAFKALPAQLKAIVYQQIHEVLSADSLPEAFMALQGRDRAGTLSLLRETSADFREYLGSEQN